MVQSRSELQRRWAKLERTTGTLTVSVLLFLILFFVVDCIAGSLLTNANHGENYFPKELYFQPRPFVGHGGTLDTKLQKTAGLNELGYRGPVPRRPKPPSEYRVILMGGSTVIIGNPNLPELLTNHFREAGLSNVAIYTFGVAASTLRMDTARLVFEAGEYSPDLIVFYGGGNDIGMPYQADPRPGVPPNFLAYEQNPLLVAGTKEQSWGTLFKLALLHSHLVRRSAGDQLRASLVPLEELRQQVGWGTSGWSDKVAQLYLDDVQRGHKLSSAFGAKALFIVQPILPFKKHRTVNEQKFLEPILEQHALRCRSVMTAGLQELHESDGIHYADISSIFESVSDEVFMDGIHIHQSHAPLVAQQVFSAMRGVAGL